ncbi:hypothetical protein [Prevotella dentasini]|uniref:hypothetical protein n=1 Tax=Prevotella dentasini TaxID=589537 RepID=UPI0004687CCA|nr:hypothetical protein [Prevotella dentasini]
MKRTVLFLTLAFLAAIGAKAQTNTHVYQQIYDAAYKVATDTREDAAVRKVASFKVDAISYLKTRTLIALSDTARQYTNTEVAHLSNQLDSMAYYMYDYVNLFTKEYQRAQTIDRARVLKIFREASINHPLYNDPDRELVLSYYNREDYLTQFSLDTDWVAALADVRRKLR